MFKKFKRLFTGLFASLLMVTTVSGCANSFFKTKNVVISDVETKTNEEGDLVITITFVDDVRDPISFTVPQGSPGNGIENITQTPSQDGSKVIVRITYTDKNVAPLTFEIANGVSIVSITSASNPNDEGETIVTITMSNGEVLVFPINTPKDGKDGNSITGITQQIDPEDNSVILIIHFSESDDITVVIPPGEKGTSVTSIRMSTSPDGNFYIYTFTMSDETTHTVTVNRPATWLTGTGRPNEQTGLVGDFYYARDLNVIYYRTNAGWIVQFDLNEVKAEPVFYSVKFDLNVTEAPWPGWPSGTTFPTSESATYFIEHGHTFYDSYFDQPYSIPTPVRDGYTFEGWYTQKTITVNSAKFTDLVSVYRNMVLYANWKAL